MNNPTLAELIAQGVTNVRVRKGFAVWYETETEMFKFDPPGVPAPLVPTDIYQIEELDQEGETFVLKENDIHDLLSFNDRLMNHRGHPFVIENLVPGKYAAIDLRYCLLTASYQGENRHAQLVMKELGISYAEAIPQSVADQWWFYNCQNVPDELPEYLKRMNHRT